MDEPTNCCFEIEWAVKKGDLVKIRRHNYDGELLISYGIILDRDDHSTDPGQLHLMPYAKVLDFSKHTIDLLGPQLLEIISAA